MSAADCPHAGSEMKKEKKKAGARLSSTSRQQWKAARQRRATAPRSRLWKMSIAHNCWGGGGGFLGWRVRGKEERGDGGVGEGVEVSVYVQLWECVYCCWGRFFSSSCHRLEQSARTAGPAAVSPLLRNPLVTCTQLPILERHLALKLMLWSKPLKFTTIVRYNVSDKWHPFLFMSSRAKMSLCEPRKHVFKTSASRLP